MEGWRDTRLHLLVTRRPCGPAVRTGVIGGGVVASACSARCLRPVKDRILGDVHDTAGWGRPCFDEELAWRVLLVSA